MSFKQMAGIFVTIVAVAGAAEVTDAEIIRFSDFSATAGLSLQGSAVRSGKLLRLTPASGAQVGSAWFATQQTLDRGFSTEFQFRVTDPGGITDDAGDDGADGLAFVIQNQSGTALGEAASSIGYEGMPNSVAVEFDTFFNSIIDDPNGNHISIQTCGTSANSAWHSDSLGCATSLPDMSDGGIHTASIHYRPGTMTIALDGATALNVPLDLASQLDLNGGKAWVGFTAATWAAYENHDILNWSVTTAPEPSPLVLLGIGAAGLLADAWRRRTPAIARAS